MFTDAFKKQRTKTEYRGASARVSRQGRSRGRRKAKGKLQKAKVEDDGPRCSSSSLLIFAFCLLPFAFFICLLPSPLEPLFCSTRRGACYHRLRSDALPPSPA